MKLNLKQKVVNSTRQEKPFVQVKGELTEAQLEAIALWRTRNFASQLIHR